jgi:hypothetical protein
VWQYDANSDGKGKADMGTGTSVKLTIPTGIKDPRELTVFLKGDGGEVQRKYKIVAPTALARPFRGDQICGMRIVIREGALTVTGVGSCAAGLYTLDGALVRRTVRAGNGDATIPNVRPGSYVLRVDVEGTTASTRVVVSR